jgi:hypothetical protein
MSPRVRDVLEHGLIVLGILALWPHILGYRETWYLALSLIVLLFLVWLAVVRVRRVRRAFEEQEERSRGTGRDPGSST